MRVLVADDHELVRKGLGKILASRGDLEAFAEASDGDEAVSMMREVQPDLVILDLSMRGAPASKPHKKFANSVRTLQYSFSPCTKRRS